MNSIQFLSLGSGSSGNAYIIQSSENTLLVDAGIGVRKLLQNLHLYGIKPQAINAILLTHDHIDHTRAAGQLSAKFQLPVYATHPVWQGIQANRVIGRKPPQELRRAIESGSTYNISGFMVRPFRVPHDSSDCVGYLLGHGDIRLCILTDAGHLTPEIEEHLGQATHLVLEANYDPYMLEHGPYPQRLRQRIRGPRGHLSNQEAASVVCHHREHLRQVWLCHISENNNRPQLALETVMGQLAQQVSLFTFMPSVQPLNHHEPTGFFTLQ